jgi:hypothetical protein
MSPPSPPAPAPAPEPLPPLRSVHTTSFAGVLEQLGISLLVTTYQAGKLVLLRADRGVVNTHFRGFLKPMGLAVEGTRLAIGTALEVWEFHNVPAVAAKLEPAGKHDACFLPRWGHATGEVLIHEMAWVHGELPGVSLQWGERRSVSSPWKSHGELTLRRSPLSDHIDEPELWFVNTRFSCLCTLDRAHSFVPRWRPPFITALAPEDRCHLNGLGLADGQVRYATALGETDTAGGWRANKKGGGILMEVPSGTVLLRGLSMPHSPRWYRGRLWLLESGTGTLGTADLAADRYEPLAELPGFTRGLDFHGDLAFVGLSQVRESAVFSGIPLTERLSERTCGVWVVDITTGQTVAFLRFEEAVQEIFAVHVVPGVRFPDLVNDDPRILSDSFVLPDDALRQLPDALRGSRSLGALLGRPQHRGNRNPAQQPNAERAREHQPHDAGGPAQQGVAVHEQVSPQPSSSPSVPRLAAALTAR